MTEETTAPTPESTTPTVTAPTPLPNSLDARTTTGEIKDAAIAPIPTPAPAPAPAVPTAYADFALPEGYTVDVKDMTDAKAMFKELGLTQDAAQRLINFQASRYAAVLAANTKAVEDMRADWVAKSRGDPVIGPKLDTEVKEAVGKALNLLEPNLRQEFKDVMNLTGVGDHPAFIKAFYELSLKVNEGKHVSGIGPSSDSQQRPGATARPSMAQAMYPNLVRQGA